uniref:Uncharacterized protein n=1 Tax=Anguilla anguilla TaxID=7936 RepID=A0A0E9VMP4_ANGAN
MHFSFHMLVPSLLITGVTGDVIMILTLQ